MPDDEIQGELPSTPGETPDNSSTDEAFNRERAMKTINALRNEVKEAKKAVADQKLQAEREKLSETDRLRADLTDLQSKLAAAQAAANERQLKSDVLLRAVKAGFNDPEDAWRMIDPAQLENEDAVSAALTDLAKKKPYLVRSETTPPAPKTAPKVSAANPARDVITLDAIKEMSPEQIARNWDKVSAVLGSGE